MDNTQLEISVAIQILKNTPEVFEAIADPSKMSHYFTSRSSGRMEAGKKLTWRFPEFDTEYPIKVDRVDVNRHIGFYWNTAGQDLLVDISLEAFGEATVVTITEKAMPNTPEGIRWLKGNTEGWTNFLCCLKAYLEYGVNLRKGAFDFRQAGSTQ